MKEIAKTESLVDAYKINKPLKLNTVNKGEPIDNVLVHGVDNEVKSVPRSEFSGGSQTIDRVLEAGNTAVDKWLTINSYEGQPTVSIIHGRFVSLINNFTGDKASLQSDQLFVSSKDDTERTTIFNNGIRFHNSWKRSTLMANPDSERSVIGKVLLPITSDSSVKTLTATDDFKTINGNSIIGTGDITIVGGGSQSLQQVINSGNKITNGANIINEYLDYSSFLGHQSLQFYNNTKGFSQLDERTLSFIDGTGNMGTLYGQGSNGQYYLPSKSSTRAYTLATTDDFKTINGNNVVGTGDIVIEGNATSGIFTPTLTGVTNVKSIAFHSATYTKVGDVVNVNVGFELSMNAANTVTRYTISLPFNRATNSPLTIGQGSCMSASSASTLSTLGQSDEKSSIRFFFIPTSTEGHLGAVTFQYSILQ